MFYTGIITDEVSQDLGTAISLAREFHLDALEIRSVNEKNPFQMTEQDFREIRSRAEEAGLKVCCISSPLFKCDIDNEAEVREHLEGLRRVAEGAHILGAEVIRGFAFWCSPAASPERIAERYRDVAALLEKENLTVALESEPSVNTKNMAELAALLELIDSPRIQALYDPGNEICDPKAPAPYPAGYELLRPRMAHVHLKDMVRTASGYDPACIGKGMVDIGGVLDALRRDQYNGYVTLETHWRVRERMDEELMTRPQGGSFSAGGEAASRICLTILRDEYGYGR